MRILLGLLICVFTFSNVSGLGLGLGPGLSVKNAFLYVIALILAIKMVIRQPKRLELRAVHVSFAVLIGYAALSLIFVVFVVRYPSYNIRTSIIDLKTNLVDWAIVFFAVFYGARSAADAEGLIEFMLLAVSAANLITIGNVSGLTNIGIDVISRNDQYQRVAGAFGDPNETGTLIALLLPAYIAAIESSHRWRKMFWVGAMMCSGVVLLMTGSRGAYVGLLLGGLWGGFLCRRYLSGRAVVKWAILGLAILAVVVIAVGPTYRHMLVARLLGDSFGDAGDISSGRTDIWARAIGLMLGSPLSMITGFGWNAWSVMGFRLVAHNHYLWLWFELGITGVLSYLAIVRALEHTALQALSVAERSGRRHLIAFAVSVPILSVSIFSLLLYTSWPFIWIYAGLSMRYALVVLAAQQKEKGWTPMIGMPEESDERRYASRIDGQNGPRVATVARRGFERMTKGDGNYRGHLIRKARPRGLT